MQAIENEGWSPRAWVGGGLTLRGLPGSWQCTVPSISLDKITELESQVINEGDIRHLSSIMMGENIKPMCSGHKPEWAIVYDRHGLSYEIECRSCGFHGFAHPAAFEQVHGYPDPRVRRVIEEAGDAAGQGEQQKGDQ